MPSTDNRPGSSPASRVFLGLYLYPETALQFVSLRQTRTEAIQGTWMNPHDLHLTILFGGEQEEKTFALWKDSARILQEALSPLVPDHRRQTAEIHWRRDRRLLAITFDRTVPFWMKAEETSRTLSGTLLPMEPFRPFWPHLTLARNARLDPRALESLSESLHALFRQHPPLWKGVRLYKSVPSPSRTEDRYRTLADHPFPGDGR